MNRSNVDFPQPDGPTARRPDDAHDLARRNLKRNIPQHFEVIVEMADTGQANFHLGTPPQKGQRVWPPLGYSAPHQAPIVLT
jgi:hypothetical protein